MPSPVFLRKTPKKGRLSLQSKRTILGCALPYSEICAALCLSFLAIWARQSLHVALSMSSPLGEQDRPARSPSGSLMWLASHDRCKMASCILNRITPKRSFLALIPVLRQQRSRSFKRAARLFCLFFDAHHAARQCVTQVFDGRKRPRF